MNKKVLIASYKYPPTPSPRAFRTEELVKEFRERGYQVDLFIPNVKLEKKLDSVNYFTVNTNNKKSDEDKLNNKTSSKINAGNFSKKVMGKLFRFIIGEDPSSVKYSFALYKKLIKLVLNKNYDLIISIGLPFYVHVAVSAFIKKSKQKGTKICDYGDPFYYNPAYNRMFLLKNFERMILKQFDYISIPTIKSLTYYSDYKKRSEIKIIPQGFDFSEISIFEYKENVKPTFCYAGVFYKGIRDPEFLFEFLASLKIDFRFIIYSRTDTVFSNYIINKYKDKLGDKLIVRDFLPREVLIKEMSKMDFLVNFENYNSKQVPSKIIDYTLSKRPILNVSKHTFDKEVFLNFMNGNYEDALKVNIEDYDIKKVVDQFEEL